MRSSLGPWEDVPLCGYCPSVADGSGNNTGLLTSDLIWVYITSSESEMWIKDLGNKSAALSVSVLMDHWRGSVFKQVLAALCDLCWLIILLHCTWSSRNLEKYIVLNGQKPLSSGHDVWFLVVLSTARALIKMVNNSLSASLCAVQMFWLCF